MELKELTIAEVWPKILRRVITCGNLIDIKNYGLTLEIGEPVQVTIHNPIYGRVCKGSGWNGAALEEYYRQLTAPNNKYGFTYTYGKRLYNYIGVNQVKENLDILDEDRNSRQAVAITWIPEQDLNSPSPPCMIIQDRWVREGRLNMSVYFRSHDAFGAYPANLYGFSRQLEEDANTLRVSPGKLYITSNKLHIYIRDVKKACEVSNIEYPNLEVLK